MTAIATIGLRKWYRSGFSRTRAVDGITFRVERGQIFGFLGPNGSGKTTTIGLLLGILRPTAGEVELLGRSGRRGLLEARRRTGATLETPNFYPYLSGERNLRLVARVKGAPDADVDRALDLVGLSDRRTDRFAAYSLGMKQRLALAATVIGDPELIILDEPANGLDPEGMREIREIILRLADEGRTIFLSSHLLAEVEKTCTHVAIIKKGQLIRQGTVDEIVETGFVYALRADDPAALAEAARTFPGAREVWTERDADADVFVELAAREPAELNRFLSGRAVFVSRLVEHRRSLEDAFIEATGDAAGESGGESTGEGSTG